MKGFRFLLLVMVICLASGVKAQFYDGPDDIYYYVACGENGESSGEGAVLIFNFDGKKACDLSGYLDLKTDRIGAVAAPPCTSDIKKNIQTNINYYEEKVENTEYSLKYISGNIYRGNAYLQATNMMGGLCWRKEIHDFDFNANRNFVVDRISIELGSTNGGTFNSTETRYFKRVDKSFFKVGRSRTPSNSLHE